MTNLERSPEVDGFAPDGLARTAQRDQADVPVTVGYAAALGMAAFATLIAFALESTASIPNLSLVYVLPVIVGAILFGFGPSMLAAVAGALSYNYFFTAPRFSLAVEDPANIWAIGLLLVVGALASGLASVAARRKVAFKLRLRQEQVLQAFSSALADAAESREMANRAAAALEEMFEVPVTVMTPVAGRLEILSATGAITAGAGETAAARSSLDQGQFMRAGVYPFDASRFDFWPIKSRGRQSVVLGLAFDRQEYPERPDLFVVVIGRLLAAALTVRGMPHNGGE